MLEDLNKALVDYQQRWQTFAAQRQNGKFFMDLMPTAAAWKTVDLAEFDQLMKDLRQHCDQIHMGWVNERWLATLHLRDQKLEWGIEVIKLMQRRPGSSDSVGLDHVDFYTGSLKDGEKVLDTEDKLKWTHETNNPHCSWLSIWFDNTEAKLRDSTVLDVCIAEMREVNEQLAK